MSTSREDEAGSASGPAFVVPESVPDGAQLWLVRHGATAWSLSGQHTGRTDLPLLEEGEAQAAALRKPFADLRPVLVLCSPRRRARRTAALAGFGEVTVDEDLAEWDYGDYEGRTSDQIREQVPGWTLWRDGVRGGETAASVRARADRVLARACTALADGPVVLVGHGHLTRILGARWIGRPVDAGEHLLLGSAARCMLSVQYGAAVIEYWNLPNPWDAKEARR